VPEIPEDLLRLAAQHVHWTYHRHSACQCEDAGSDEHDVEQARQIIEALWPVAYRAGRDGAARDIGVVAEAAGWGEVWAQCVSIARGVSDAPTQAAEVDQPRTLLPGEVQDDPEAQR
jgi:hypothetical protein